MFRLDVFRHVDSRCAIARVSLEAKTQVRCLALLRTEVLRIDRSLYGQCRACSARSSHAPRHDELGHPGLSAALEWSSGSAWERFRR